MQFNESSIRLQCYNPSNFNFKGILNLYRSTKIKDSDKVIKVALKVVFGIYMIAQS
jgi:hypothetical protein